MSVCDVTSVLERDGNVLICKSNFNLQVFAFICLNLSINACKYANNYK